MTCCLLIHGFTGGIFEVSPLAAYLESHRYHARTFTLKGHEGGRAALRSAGRHDWVQGAEEELEALLHHHPKVHLVGFSTGALIASRLAVRHKERIPSLTLLSAPVYPLNPPQIMRTLLSPEMLRKYVMKFGATPPKATREFWRMVAESFEVYPRIEVPTLIVQGRQDHLVKPKSAAYLHATIPCPRKEMLIQPRSGHLVCHGEDSSALMEGVLRFMRESV